MGKHTQATMDVFSIFGNAAWVSAFGANKTFPQDFTGGGDEFIRVSVVLSGRGINRVSSSGVLIIEIYTAAGLGPERQNFIADLLDSFLENKSVITAGGKNTQFQNSTLMPQGTDKANPALAKARYELPMNYFGVT
jgi:hypothetical protein